MAMDERTRAEEHLRVIRSLLERVTVYRAISAPTALVGGVASLIVAIWMLWRTGFIGSGETDVALTARDFITPWLLPLVLTGFANTFFIWREARRDQRPFLSAGLRLALRSLLPAMLIGAAITYVAWRNPTHLDGPVVVALSWISFYGLALLATMNFAPRSLSILGWSFVITAVVWLLLLSAPTLPAVEVLHGQSGANLAMGLTFGVYHLLYVVCILSGGTGKTRALE
ncbi:MAG: hypothetical protein ABR589_01230 [Chthoniobacterales bacterium]